MPETPTQLRHSLLQRGRESARAHRGGPRGGGTAQAALRNRLHRRLQPGPDVGTPQTPRGRRPAHPRPAVRVQLRAVGGAVGGHAGGARPGHRHPRRRFAERPERPAEIAGGARKIRLRLRLARRGAAPERRFYPGGVVADRQLGPQSAVGRKHQRRRLLLPGVQTRVHREPEIFQGDAPVHADAVQDRGLHRHRDSDCGQSTATPARATTACGTGCSRRSTICSRCAG